MTFSILLLGGLALALAAAFMTSRPYEVTPSLAADATAVGLGDAGTETMAAAGTDEHRAVNLPRADWQLATVHALSDAEDLLDCLENQGFEERELVILGNSCFAVRWR